MHIPFFGSSHCRLKSPNIRLCTEAAGNSDRRTKERRWLLYSASWLSRLLGKDAINRATIRYHLARQSAEAVNSRPRFSKSSKAAGPREPRLRWPRPRPRDRSMRRVATTLVALADTFMLFVLANGRVE